MTAPQDEVTHDPAGDRLLDVVVVGGSQAGLTMAWHLTQQGLRFVVLEAGPEVGHVWRSRWDSLKLFTPSQYDALPGMAFPAPADTYPTKDPVADYLQAYAAAFQLPVRLNAQVTSLTRTDDGFEVRTADEVFRARQVVVATGPFQVPFVPPAASKLDPSVTQVHSAHYRNPRPSPTGRCWWSAAATPGSRSPRSWPPPARSTCRSPSGCRCCRSGWPARTCSGGSPRLGLLRVTVNSRLGRRVSPREFIIGTNKRRLRKAGVRFRPRLVDAEGRMVRFADHSTLEDVRVVVWATGYRSDYAWIHIPGVVREGRLVHRRGVTEVPGLYFLGLSWQNTRGSALLGFVDDDAAWLADRVAIRHQAAVSATVPATQEPSS